LPCSACQSPAPPPPTHTHLLRPSPSAARSSKQRPKRLALFLSDFSARDVLVKGGEDLRLDARVLALFAACNGLAAGAAAGLGAPAGGPLGAAASALPPRLRSQGMLWLLLGSAAAHAAASARCQLLPLVRAAGSAAGLAVRTYGVAPLSPQLGLVEFVAGAQPLEGVLCPDHVPRDVMDDISHRWAGPAAWGCGGGRGGCGCWLAVPAAIAPAALSTGALPSEPLPSPPLPAPPLRWTAWVEQHATRPLVGDYSGVLALPREQVAAQLSGTCARVRADGLREALLRASGARGAGRAPGSKPCSAADRRPCPCRLSLAG
jgi:hypothetical protein